MLKEPIEMRYIVTYLFKEGDELKKNVRAIKVPVDKSLIDSLKEIEPKLHSIVAARELDGGEYYE